jgi:ribonuclease III
VPDYHIDQTGPDHAKTFTAWAVVAGQRHGGVTGKTKKEAEQRAAEAAYVALKPVRTSPNGNSQSHAAGGHEVGV